MLSEIDAAYAADKFINYFSNTGRIDEYLRNVKLDRMAQLPVPLFGMGPEDDLFTDFDMHPNSLGHTVIKELIKTADDDTYDRTERLNS